MIPERLIPESMKNSSVKYPNRQGLKELERLAMVEQRKKYPTVPEHCRPKAKFTDQNTNGLTMAVITTFQLHGFFATRIDSKGTYNQALKRFIPSNQKKGLPDVFAQGQGFAPIWVEVKCKATRDRLKPHQKEVIDSLRNSGAIVFIAEDYQSFYEWFKSEILQKQLINT
jgi:hypothetical protein